jgi:hypothetical protein
MSYKNSRRDEAIANEFLAVMHPCNKCGQQAEREVIVAFGGMCGRCYGLYCREGCAHAAPVSPERRRQIVEAAKAVLRGATADVPPGQAATTVKRLRAQEASGKRLTDGQRWVLDRCEAKLGVSA